MARVRSRLLLTGLLAAAGLVSRAPDAAAQPLWSLRPELRIGEPEAALTEVTDLAVGPDGAMYVLQPQEQAVKVFDPTGRLRAMLGRRGRGPGEFQWPLHLGWVRDTLWVSDPNLGRVTFFESGSRVAGTLALTAPGGTGQSRNTPSALLADGSALAAPGVGAEGARAGVHVPILRLDRAGRVLDTLALRSTAHAVLVLGDGAVSTFQPFRDALLTAPLPGGTGVVLVERTAAARAGRAFFRVTRLTPKGDTLFSRRYHYTPRPVPPRLADSLVAAAVADHRGQFGTQAQAERTVRRGLYLPPFHPPVTDVVAGRDGTVWLRREEGGGSTVEWLVLGRNGDLLARVATPRVLKLYEAQRDRAWGVLHDGDGVPSVVRYRVESPATARR